LPVIKKTLSKVPIRCGANVRADYSASESAVRLGQHAVVRFLTLKKLSGKDIATELEKVYGLETLSFGGQYMAQAIRQRKNTLKDD
jgi:hypothetical protein